MRSKPRPLAPEALYPRRLAGRALARALDGFELDSVARRFNADDPSECLSAGQGEFVFGDGINRRWSPLATVFLDGNAARVVVEKVGAIIRSTHLRDFEPEAVGIFPSAGQPDIDVNVDIADVIETDGELFRTAPQRILARRAQPFRRPEVLRSVGRHR